MAPNIPHGSDTFGCIGGKLRRAEFRYAVVVRIGVHSALDTDNFKRIAEWYFVFDKFVLLVGFYK